MPKPEIMFNLNSESPKEKDALEEDNELDEDSFSED